MDDDDNTVVPLVYIADLAAYNEGDLVGKHFKPNDYADADEFSAAVSEYITHLPHPAWTGPREEWAIHDFEGFGDYRIDEYESLEKVWEIADRIERHGLAYTAFVAYRGEVVSDEQFEEAFAGEWESEKVFAQNQYEEYFQPMVPEGSEFAYPKPTPTAAWEEGWPYNCIDWDHATHELMFDYYSARTGKGDGSVYIFRTS